MLTLTFSQHYRIISLTLTNKTSTSFSSTCYTQYCHVTLNTPPSKRQIPSVSLPTSFREILKLISFRNSQSSSLKILHFCESPRDEGRNLLGVTGDDGNCASLYV